MKYCPICERSYEDRFLVCEIDGATLRIRGAKQDSLVGTVVKGRYRVLKKLGEGGMGAVYLADQFSINRKVALKILHPNYARDEDFVKRFRQEAMLAASFSHHNAITVYDFDQSDDGRLFIAMEYVDGHSLSTVIKNQQLEIGRALRLGIQIAEGLSAAHRAGIIHRDIKPENIMVVEGDGDVKLMDFGIARLRDSAAATRLTQPGKIMGTPAYMAPEQIEGGEVSERTDIYAFGIVLYELLTNRVPFTATTPNAILLQQLKDNPLPVSRIRNQVPKSVERIVSRALEKNPKKRFATMDEVVEALKSALRNDEQPDPNQVSAPAPNKPDVRRSLGAVMTSFKRLFSKRSVESDAEQTRDKSSKTPATSISSTKPSANENAAYLPSEEEPRTLRADHVNKTLDGHETSAPEIIGQGRPDVQRSSRGQVTSETTASPPTETFAQTVALTQPRQTTESAIQKTQHIDEAARDADLVLPPEKTPDIPVRNADAGFESRAEQSDLDHRNSADGRTELIDRQVQLAQRPTAAGDISVTPSWQPDDSIAETAIFSQRVEQVTIQKRSWITAATASLILLLAVVTGLAVYRNLPVEQTRDKEVVEIAKEDANLAEQTASPPLPITDQGKIDSKETDPLLPSTKSAPGSVTRPQGEPQYREAMPANATPEVKAEAKSRAKTLAPIKVETPSIKPAKKTPFPLDTVTVKKPDTVVSTETKPSGSTKIDAPNRDQNPNLKPITTPEKADSGTKKLAPLKQSPVPQPASKKSQELSDDHQTASLRQPEAPTPLPRVELKDLSIIARKRELSVEERVVLAVRGKYSDGNEVDIKAGIQWKSSDPSVASVNAKGEIQALKEGTTQISATYQGVLSGNYTFNVKASEETRKPDSSGEQIKDLRRRLLR